MMESITLLGTGTCELNANRRASSVLITTKNEKIVFDMGHGIFDRLAELEIKNNEINNIIISHFHPDHVSDLVPFLQSGAWSRQEPREENRVLHIWGPEGLQDFINKMLDFYGSEALISHQQIKIHEIKEGSYEIAGKTFSFASLPPASNHGVSFTLNGNQIALTGDSYFHQNEVDFLKDKDFAVIDAGHPTPEEIVKLASETQVGTLCCSHIYAELNLPKLQSAAKNKGFKGRIIIGEDLQNFTF